MTEIDVMVIGGGPAGLAAAIAANKTGAKVLLAEREARLGGILKQCIHDGFGLVRFGEKLSGPEYAERFIEELWERGIPYLTMAFVTALEKCPGGYRVSVVTREGIWEYKTKALVLATGCRERTARQVFIHGTRPAGIYTAGCAQHFTNLLGELPTRKCVILGSGDIGLIMARRLTLEGAKVEGVYEVKPTPSGLTRNIVQCLEDFDIPLYLSHTVTRVFGDDRLTGVEISRVDERMRPIPGTEYRVDCDALILSVGLIPENEMAGQLGIPMDGATKGPVCDTRFMTLKEGVFSCGNALHVNDLADYVSESGEQAGRNAAIYAAKSSLSEAREGTKGQGQKESDGILKLEAREDLLYLVPQRIRLSQVNERAVLYFRSREVRTGVSLSVKADGKEVFSKKYAHLKPPEMERLELDFGTFGLRADSRVVFSLQETDKAGLLPDEEGS